jgi:hypothetical protein
VHLLVYVVTTILILNQSVNFISRQIRCIYTRGFNVSYWWNCKNIHDASLGDCVCRWKCSFNIELLGPTSSVFFLCCCLECFAFSPHYGTYLLQIAWFCLLSTHFIVIIINVFIMFWHEFDMKITVIWHVTLRSVAEGYWLCRGSICLQQGQEEWWYKLDCIKHPGGRGDWEQHKCWYASIRLRTVTFRKWPSYSPQCEPHISPRNLTVGASSFIQSVSISLFYWLSLLLYGWKWIKRRLWWDIHW